MGLFSRDMGFQIKSRNCESRKQKAEINPKAETLKAEMLKWQKAER
jgi:hypothetical protein